MVSGGFHCPLISNPFWASLVRGLGVFGDVVPAAGFSWTGT